ncbi:MAG TPA: thiol reductant ABC exporter subunit CydC [Thiolinea sp.]|nr:thiol reductant ABC exporter subunit CydC [Thiolinea sp.]
MKDLLRLLQLFRPYRGQLALGLLLALLTLLANIGLLALSGWFITAMALAGAAGVSMNYFTPAALIRLMAIVRTAGRYGERLVTHDLTLRVLAELRVRFYRSIEPLAPAVLEQWHSGDLLSRIRADIDRLDAVLLRLLLPVLVALIGGSLIVLTLLWFHPLLALAELVLLLLAGVLMPWVLNRLGRIPAAALVETRARLRSALVTDLQGMGELLVFGAAEAHARQLEALSTTLATQQQRMARLQGWAQGALELGARLALWSVLVLGIPLLHQQQITPPELIMLSLLALAGFEAILPLPLAFQSLGETLAAARRIFALADTLPAVTEPEQPRLLQTPLNISIRQLGFRYHPDAIPVLRDFSLELPAGTQQVITGPSGTGKSTLISLLLRFRAPDSGELLLNGHAISEYDSEAVRAQIAVAPQHNHLFNASIRDNLRLARPEATPAQLEQACEQAGLLDFIHSQPDGFDTWCGETGLSLSGGQARRLAVARALLKDAPVLVLDEPTEGLDATTARQLLRQVREHASHHGKSLLLITHRLQGLEDLPVLRLD